MDAVCPGCGVVLPAIEGPVHRYMESSPSCWAEYGKVLAREYGDPALMEACHRMTTDAYAAQHPGKPSPQSIQSVAIHLIALHAVLERNLPHAKVRSLIGHAADQMRFEWLERPRSLGDVTAADVARAETSEEHVDAVMSWAGAVWRAWGPHHERIRQWTDDAWNSIPG
jgi:hypothetical protein